jgi:hypothetical protein
MTVTWSEAADMLEAFLEEAGNLVDGEEPPQMPSVGALEFIDSPDEALIIRVRSLLADTEEAIVALALRRAEIQQELDHTDRLRSAGAGYLRYQ